jgi:REP element-mobilizing transposase RayT
MARHLRIQNPGAYYQIACRGNERKAVFRSHLAREQFLASIQSVRKRYGAALHAYCLLHNPCHLLFAPGALFPMSCAPLIERAPRIAREEIVRRLKMLNFETQGLMCFLGLGMENG